MSVNKEVKSEKDKALEAAMAQIQKQFGKGAIMKLGDAGAQMNVEARITRTGTLFKKSGKSDRSDEPSVDIPVKKILSFAGKRYLSDADSHSI